MTQAKDVLKLVLKSIDEKQLTEAVLNELVKPALEKVVKDSSNPIDDAVLAMAWPIVEKSIVEGVNALIEKVEGEQA